MDEVDLNGSDERDGIASVARSPHPHTFSLPALVEYFSAALTGDGCDVQMAPYLSAFKEIVKFLELLGTVFHFVIADVNSKIAILENYAGASSECPSSRSACSVASNTSFATTAQHYSTVLSMVEHEVATGALIDKRREATSGCRTLLRLHRALEYTLLFFRRLHQSGDGDKLSSLSGSVYNETLSKHHPWMIRKAVSVAMYAMPSRRSLIEKMTGHSIDEHGRLAELLLRAADAGKPVYDNVQVAFAKHNLLELP